MHTEKQRLEKAHVLATEALKLELMCRNDVSDEEKEYQLSQVAALARDVVCDTNQYDPAEDISGMGSC